MCILPVIQPTVSTLKNSDTWNSSPGRTSLPCIGQHHTLISECETEKERATCKTGNQPHKRCQAAAETVSIERCTSSKSALASPCLIPSSPDWHGVYTLQPIVQPVVQGIAKCKQHLWIKHVECIQPVAQKTSCTTSCTTGCMKHVECIQPVVQPVVQLAVWNMLNAYNRLYNQLDKLCKWAQPSSTWAGQLEHLFIASQQVGCMESSMIQWIFKTFQPARCTTSYTTGGTIGYKVYHFEYDETLQWTDLKWLTTTHTQKFKTYLEFLF